MGLSIHYSGRIGNRASLPDLIEEVKDIANIYQWKLSVFKEEFPVQGDEGQLVDGELYGVAFSPPNCEPVWLSFLSNGRMSTPVALKFFGEQRDEDEKKYLYQLSTKTQFAGINVHQVIIHLLKYLKEKYLEDFVLLDEGQYWETNDKSVLEANFSRYTLLLDIVEDGLKNLPMNPGESMEAYFERMTKGLKRKGDQK
ncbi:MAG: hypothetical protein ACMVP2_16980 [Imperialibacter sp.]|uniref:hypothetical protein n=1 Tax=Imperialibacter sp. TaxID=2038411 RepID=UPI003A883AC1